MLLHRCFCHGEGIVTALKMLVAQNRTAHNGEIGVGADEVVGQEIQKIKELLEHRCVDLHGDVLLVESDAVLVVVAVGGILQLPRLIMNANADRPQILPCRMSRRSGKAGVLRTELTLGIGNRLLRAGSCNVPRVFLRLGAVDGDVQHAVFRGICPLDILGDSAGTDVVHILVIGKIPVGRRLGRNVVFLPKCPLHLSGIGCHAAHQTGVKPIPHTAGVFDQTLFTGIVHQFRQNLVHTAGILRRFRCLPRCNMQHVHQLVPNHDLVLRLNQSGADRIRQQVLNFLTNHCATPSFIIFLHIRRDGSCANSMRWK